MLSGYWICNDNICKIGGGTSIIRGIRCPLLAYVKGLQVAEDLVGRNAFGRADLAEDRAEQSESERLTLRDGDTMLRGSIAFDKDVTAALPVYGVVPMPDEMLDQAVARKAGWGLQATASSSASTNLTRAGLAEVS